MAGKPLSGIRVLDFSRVLAGPFCTAILADQGAQIIKIEPPQGDDQRWMGAVREGKSLNFELFNRSKRSLKLNLRNPQARVIAQRLAVNCDVVIENFRPNVAARLEIDAKTLCALKADLIYCSISGFGQTGKMAQMPSYDVIAQALSGMMSITGHEDGPPVFFGDSIGDIVSGIYAAQAISAALVDRQRSGRGAVIDLAMFDVLLSLMPTFLALWQASGKNPMRTGNQHPLSAPFGTFAARDDLFVLAIANKALFVKFSHAISQSQLADDPRFLSDQLRFENRHLLRQIIEEWASNYSVQEVVQMLNDAGIPASPIWNFEQAVTSEQTRERKILHEREHPQLGKLYLPEQPAHFEGDERGLVHFAPDLGEHGEEILYELLGMTDVEIEELHNHDVI